MKFVVAIIKAFSLKKYVTQLMQILVRNIDFAYF